MENTIFFGNGLNRLSPKNISWSHLLDTIKGPRKFNDALLPNTMIYERIILERPFSHKDMLFDEFEVKKEIAKLMESIEPNTIYESLFNLNAQNYITTNYDYGYLDSIIENDEVLKIEGNNTEDVYSIRRVKTIRNLSEKRKDFWQIHGEILKPATIMLGLDHYCGSIGKIDSYIKGFYKYVIEKEQIEESSIEKKFLTNTFNYSSWVELFFTSNIHIIGFSFDYSEIDLWWILNKRARLKKADTLRNRITNEIVFYCNSIDDQKKGLLESLDVKVQIDKLSEKETKYIDYYKKLIRRFQQKF